MITSIADAARVHLIETASTNAEAMVRALAGAPTPFWVTAESQTAGKGRSGRAWQSPVGNLYASLALSLTCDRATAVQLSLVAGVAAHATLSRAIKPSQLTLKWPNDLMVGQAKLGGILIETTATHQGLIAIVGFGLNLVSAPILDRPTTDMATLGAQLAAVTVLSDLALALDEVVAIWDEGRDFAAIRSRWLAASTPLGSPMTVSTRVGAKEGEAGFIRGTFAGLDGEGALLLAHPSGQIDRISFGDVTVGGAPAGSDAA